MSVPDGSDSKCEGEGQSRVTPNVRVCRVSAGHESSGASDVTLWFYFTSSFIIMI